jgi:hypothetical protein
MPTYFYQLTMFQNIAIHHIVRLIGNVYFQLFYIYFIVNIWLRVETESRYIAGRNLSSHFLCLLLVKKTRTKREASLPVFRNFINYTHNISHTDMDAVRYLMLTLAESESFDVQHEP